MCKHVTFYLNLHFYQLYPHVWTLQGITDQLYCQKCQIEKITTSCSPIVWSACRGDDVTVSAYIYITLVALTSYSSILKGENGSEICESHEN